MAELLFGEWTPDTGDYDNSGGVTVANNVLPYEDSYKSFPSPVVYSSALDNTCKGAVASRDNEGNAYNFAGSTSKLALLSNGVYDDVSKAGGYDVAADGQWFFTQWGNQLIATNGTDPVQAFAMGIDSKFSDLAATAPKARYCTVVRDQVVLGNINDPVAGLVPYRVQWGQLGAPGADWTPNAATQADFQDLPSENGWVQQIVGGAYGVIFQERAITIQTYVGSPLIYRFDTAEFDRGTPAPGSVTRFSNNVPYLGIDGFYIFDSQVSQPIGAGKVDKTFYGDLDQNYFNRICSTIDPINKIIFWAYPGSGNTGGNPNKIIAFNYSATATKRWASADLDLEYIYRSLAEGYTLEGLDNVSTNLDNLLFSLDSRVWQGNSALLSGFNSSHQQVNFTGSALTGTIATQEGRLNKNGRALVTKVRPIVEGYETISISMGHRSTLAAPVTYDAANTPEVDGNISARANDFYHRALVTLTGGFDHAKGIDIVKVKNVGGR